MLMRSLLAVAASAMLVSTAQAGASEPPSTAAAAEAGTASAFETQLSERLAAVLPAHLAPGALHVPASIARLEPPPTIVAVRWRRPPRAGHTTVMVELDTAEGQRRKVWVRLDVLERRAVLVAARPLVAGMVVGADDLRVALVALPEGQGLELSPAGLLGARVVGAIDEGAVIDAEVVELPPPIARGTSVTVIVRYGRVEVRTPAVLERAAQLGELATARLISQRRLLKGRLISADVVLIAGEAP